MLSIQSRDGKKQGHAGVMGGSWGRPGSGHITSTLLPWPELSPWSHLTMREAGETVCVLRRRGKQVW